MILIDTSAFIEFLNHTGSLFDKEIEYLISNDEDLALADITITEILQGIKDDKEFIEIKKSLMAFPIYSLKGVDSYIAAAELYRKCRKKGHTIRSTIDLLIAQIALEHNLILLHNDNDLQSIASLSGLRGSVTSIMQILKKGIILNGFKQSLKGRKENYTHEKFIKEVEKSH